MIFLPFRSEKPLVHAGEFVLLRLLEVDVDLWLDIVHQVEQMTDDLFLFCI
jgi:alpha-D-ribose 1-methylphosphonate 5-triphosphate synthase subunit PhnH